MKIDSSVNIQSSNTNNSGDYTVQVSPSHQKSIGKSTDKALDMEVSESLLNKSIEKANSVLINSNRKVERAIHETTKVVIYKVVDTETDEVIKEFPPEKIQDMIAKMWELAGLFVDEQA